MSHEVMTWTPAPPDSAPERAWSRPATARG